METSKKCKDACTRVKGMRRVFNKLLVKVEDRKIMRRGRGNDVVLDRQMYASTHPEHLHTYRPSP